MSVADTMQKIFEEIPRLQTAKVNIKTAIENKGIIVGDGTIDTYAELISQITGDNLPSNITAINGGTWTQETALSTSSVLEIEHGLTDIPDAIIITSDIFEIAPTQSYYLASMGYEKHAVVDGAIYASTDYAVYRVGEISTRVKYALGQAQQGITAVDENKFTITAASNRQLGVGVTYSWIAVSFTDGVEVDPSYDYNQGYEDGKNSVVDIAIYIKNRPQFTSLNMFGTSAAVLNLDGIYDGGDLLNMFNITTADNANTTVEHLTVNCPALIDNMQQTFFASNSDSRDKKLKRLTLNIDTQNVAIFTYCFGGLNALEVIDGLPLDFSSSTNHANIFNLCNALVEFRVVPNTIKLSLNLQWCDKLSTETIQSIFDGLATVDTAQTLTLHANLKILQSQVDSANAKGWTVAGGTVVSEEEYYG